LLTSALAVAGPLPPQFTLGGYIPDDVFFFANTVKNPERAWIVQKWDGVLDALLKSGIDTDLISLAYSLTSDEDHAAVRANIERASALLKAVKWGDLCDRELAFAERITTTLPVYEYLILTRGNPETIDTNMAGLVAVFKELASLSDRFTITQRSVKGADVWSMPVTGVDDPHFAMNIDLFRKGDVIGLVIGSKLAGEVLALMAQDRPGRSILTSPRFGKAVAQLKPPDDSVVFADLRLALREAAGLIEHLAAEKPGKTVQAVRKAEKIIALCDVVDYTVSTQRTEGRRVFTQTVTRTQPGKSSSPLARAFLHRKPFQPFDRYIPAETTGFKLDALIDPQPLYQVIIDFISEEIAGGAVEIAWWNELLSSVGFDPHRDLFSWLSGEMISVTIPCCVATPMWRTDSVHMIRVKDPALASQKINSAVNFAQAKLAAAGQMLMVSPADVKAEGFRTITHPAVAMYVSPVIGIKDDWLFISTSASAINKCLDVAAGKAPSIRANERFLREGLIPDGPVRSASFADRSNIGAEWGGKVGMVGTIGGMFAAGIPDEPRSRKVKKLLQTLLPVVLKLRPVLQMIDFYSSEAAVTVFDGITIREERVVTYKGSTPCDSPQTVKVPCPVRR
jgi:hypothetical protein